MRRSAVFLLGTILGVGVPFVALACAVDHAANSTRIIVAQSTGGNQGTDVPGPGGGPIANQPNAQGNYGAQSTGGNQGTDVPGPGGGPIANQPNAQGNYGAQSTGGSR